MDRAPRSFLVAATCCCLFAACGAKPRDELVPLEQTPAKFVDAAREKLPDVTFDQVLQRPNGQFELRGTTSDGKVRKIELSAAGEVVNIE